MKNKKRIILIEERKLNTVTYIKKRFPGEKLCVCDFHLKDCEKGKQKPHGIEYKNILLIDHHAPLKRMAKKVSSTNLAIAYVKKYGHLPEDYTILINHTDCDSILSSHIMRGLLKPLEKFGNAAIAADHTGAKNKIADLLQALDSQRNISLSIKNLQLLLENKSLQKKVMKLVQKREKERAKIKELVKKKKFIFHKSVAFAILNKKVDAALIPPFLPKAKVIFIAVKSKFGKWIIKIRLGKNAKNIRLNKLKLPDFGGRWNAGSTKRGGGTPVEPEAYAKIIAKKIR